MPCCSLGVGAGGLVECLHLPQGGAWKNPSISGSPASGYSQNREKSLALLSVRYSLRKEGVGLFSGFSGLRSGPHCWQQQGGGDWTRQQPLSPGERGPSWNVYLVTTEPS